MVEAAKWYRRAAYHNHAHGQNNLGRCYENGWGVMQDLDMAAKWYKKSAQQGNSAGKINASRAMQREMSKSGSSQQLSTPDKLAASSTASGGEGHFNLGLCYEHGWGVDKDLKIAVKCYLKAAEQGNPFGQNRLAAMYEAGEGIEKNAAEAQKWYDLAEAQGICWKK